MSAAAENFLIPAEGEKFISALRPPSRPTWVGPLPKSRVAMLVAVDSRGFLVPLFTAGDLLRACKLSWKVSLNR